LQSKIPELNISPWYCS